MSLRPSYLTHKLSRAPEANRQRYLPQEKEKLVARKTVFVSDLTGKEIGEGTGAQLIIKYQDARRGQVVLDVNASEVDDIARKGQRQARRGRRPKSETGKS
jgi:hypothetical protein